MKHQGVGLVFGTPVMIQRRLRRKQASRAFEVTGKEGESWFTVLFGVDVVWCFPKKQETSAR